MKLPQIVSLSLLAAFALAAAPDAGAQDLKIAVADIQAALNKYYKTNSEIKNIEEIAGTERAAVDERVAALNILNNKLGELEKKVNDTSLSEEARRGALSEAQNYVAERTGKLRELEEARRAGSEKVLQARQAMEQRLVEDVKKVVEQIAAEKGFDMVVDKSFLPRANKVLVYTSEKVPDLTEDIIAALNKDAPPEAAAPAATGEQ